ncbi:MAG: FimB/Mfa2 family fimbrial subunit [Bacteroidales bacterium]|nr:FimB/Mfa2 family fimbrial subunit [Bacteroidales bacterium]
MKRPVLIIMCVCCAISSCIKEDRSDCPCYLSVDLSQIEIEYIDKVDLVMSASDVSEAQWISVERSFIGDTLVVPVKRREFDLCAWGNLKGSQVDTHTNSIISADRPDSLWSSYHHVSARCEDAYVKVTPQRRFIPVTIIVRGMISSVVDIEPVLTQVSSGFDFNGNPAGKLAVTHPKLTHTPDSEADYYTFESLLLNQPSATDAGLELTYSSGGRERRTSYPLGRMLLEEGEDISLANGNPVVVDLVLGQGNIFLTIEIEQWQAHDVIDITF